MLYSSVSRRGALCAGAGSTCSLSESPCWKPLGPTLHTCFFHRTAMVLRKPMKWAQHSKTTERFQQFRNPVPNSKNHTCSKHFSCLLWFNLASLVVSFFHFVLCVFFFSLVSVFHYFSFSFINCLSGKNAFLRFPQELSP